MSSTTEAIFNSSSANDPEEGATTNKEEERPSSTKSLLPKPLKKAGPAPAPAPAHELATAFGTNPHSFRTSTALFRHLRQSGLESEGERGSIAGEEFWSW